MTTTINIIQGRQSIFKEFSFFISENLKQLAYRDAGSTLFNQERLDKKFNIQERTFYLETHRVNEKTCDFLLSKFFQKPIRVTYEFEKTPLNMTISSETLKDTKIDKCSDEEISFIILKVPTIELELFENISKVCIKYYQEFFMKNCKSDEKMDIYLNSGEYWMCQGTKFKRNMDTLYLPKKQKTDIRKDLENFLKPETREKYKMFGVNYKRIYMLEGIPGSGKTSLILALASEFGYGLSIAHFDRKMDDRAFISLIREMPEKTFMLLEDMDVMFESRKKNDEEQNSITFSGLLNAFDGIATKDDFICFITTNRIHTFDKSLVRPGRIDYFMNFDYATKEQVLDMFKMFMCKSNIWSEKELEENANRFYRAISELFIKINVSILQQYLFQYMDNPEDVFKNVLDIKSMYAASNTQKDADEIGIYQ